MKEKRRLNRTEDRGSVKCKNLSWHLLPSPTFSSFNLIFKHTKNEKEL